MNTLLLRANSRLNSSRVLKWTFSPHSPLSAHVCTTRGASSALGPRIKVVIAKIPLVCNTVAKPSYVWSKNSPVLHLSAPRHTTTTARSVPVRALKSPLSHKQTDINWCDHSSACRFLDLLGQCTVQMEAMERTVKETLIKGGLILRYPMRRRNSCTKKQTVSMQLRNHLIGHCYVSNLVSSPPPPNKQLQQCLKDYL